MQSFPKHTTAEIQNSMGLECNPHPHPPKTPEFCVKRDAPFASVSGGCLCASRVLWAHPSVRTASPLDSQALDCMFKSRCKFGNPVVTTPCKLRYVHEQNLQGRSSELNSSTHTLSPPPTFLFLLQARCAGSTSRVKSNQHWAMPITR